MTAVAVRDVRALKKPENMSEQLTDAQRKRNTLILFSTANMGEIFEMCKKKRLFSFNYHSGNVQRTVPFPFLVEPESHLKLHDTVASGKLRFFNQSVKA